MHKIFLEIRRALAAAFLSLTAMGVSLGPVVYCLDKVIDGRALELFRLGNLPVPWLYTATYLDVLIFFAVGFAVSIIGVYFQYRAYREEEDFKRKYGIKEHRAFEEYMLEKVKAADRSKRSSAHDYFDGGL